MVEHVAIADEDRHEPKHASTAVAKQVCTSIGGGATEFAFVNYDDIVGTPTPQGYKSVLAAFSAGNQTPSALDTPLQVNFGSPQATTDVNLAANGTITFNTDGDYAITLLVRFGRTALGGNAVILSRYLVNDVQGLNTNAISLPDANSITPFSVNLFVTAIAGDTFKLQIMRDSSGVNVGGLTALVPTLAGWNVSPSATIVVSKYVGSV